MGLELEAWVGGLGLGLGLGLELGLGLGLGLGLYRAGVRATAGARLRVDLAQRQAKGGGAAGRAGEELVHRP